PRKPAPRPPPSALPLPVPLFRTLRPTWLDKEKILRFDASGQCPLPLAPAQSTPSLVSSSHTSSRAKTPGRWTKYSPPLPALGRVAHLGGTNETGQQTPRQQLDYRDELSLRPRLWPPDSSLGLGLDNPNATRSRLN